MNTFIFFYNGKNKTQIILTMTTVLFLLGKINIKTGATR